MNDLNLFIDVLNNEVLIQEYREPLTSRQIVDNSFDLIENHPDAACKNASFKGDNCDKLTIFKFDKQVMVDGSVIRHPLVFFRHNDSRCLNDYTIFYPFEKNGNQYLFVVLCNMKSANLGNNKKQLEAGVDFAKYLVSTAFRLAKKSTLRSNHLITQSHDIQQNINVKYVKLLFSTSNEHQRKMNVSLQTRTSANYNTDLKGYVDLLGNGIQTCDLDILAATHRNRTR